MGELKVLAVHLGLSKDYRTVDFEDHDSDRLSRNHKSGQVRRYAFNKRSMCQNLSDNSSLVAMTYTFRESMMFVMPRIMQQGMMKTRATKSDTKYL